VSFLFLLVVRGEEWSASHARYYPHGRRALQALAAVLTKFEKTRRPPDKIVGQRVPAFLSVSVRPDRATLDPERFPLYP